ncbi:hypothetical protein VRRI112168_06750 [Vreelandella rituensis]|uniref:hypothetical protein n=1 Tax=Vreelandella rituensis TaxID=2282306 RepID=UPI0015F00055|nr:hypothetical protein [Halomonas rituensis]
MLTASSYIASWLIILTIMGIGSLALFAPSLTVIILMLLGLALGALRLGHIRLSHGLAALGIVFLLPGLASYLLPEGWISSMAWQAGAALLQADTPLEDWRPPVLTTFNLLLLALSLLLSQRSRLGTPLLLTASALFIAWQLLQLQATPTALLLHAPARLPELAALGCLTLAQWLHARRFWANPITCTPPCGRQCYLSPSACCYGCSKSTTPINNCRQKWPHRTNAWPLGLQQKSTPI